MDNWLTSITTWLWNAVKAVFTALVDFVHDVALWVFDAVLSAVVSAVSAIPLNLPSGGTIWSFLNVLPSGARYLVTQLNLPAVFAVLVVGITFRLARKVVTLFQW